MSGLSRDARHILGSDNHHDVHLVLQREWKRDLRGTFASAAQRRSIEVMVSTIEFAVGVVDGPTGTQILKDVIRIFYHSYDPEFLRCTGWWPRNMCETDSGSTDSPKYTTRNDGLSRSSRVDATTDAAPSSTYHNTRDEFQLQGREIARESMIKSIQLAIGLCNDHRVPDEALKVLKLCYGFESIPSYINDADDAYIEPGQSYLDSKSLRRERGMENQVIQTQHNADELPTHLADKNTSESSELQSLAKNALAGTRRDLDGDCT